MSCIKGIVLFFTVCNIFDQTRGLVELPKVKDNDIVKTEAAVRSITNQLFTDLKLKGVKEKQRLKEYSLVHNYFVSLTLQDYNTLKEIARLTRVDNKIFDNGTVNVIDLLNQVLNEDSKEIEYNVTRYEDMNEDLTNSLDGYIKGLAYLRDFYKEKIPHMDINKDVIDILTRENFGSFSNGTESQNSLSVDDDNVLQRNDFFQTSGRRVYRGTAAKIKHFPFVVVVQVFNRFQCAGSIVKNDLILTAASCIQLAYNNRLYRENPSFLSIRVGSNYYDGGGEVVSVMEVYFHPSYNPGNLRNNLALLRLTRLLYFGTRRVKQIEIDKHNHELPMNANGITIVGWGAKTKSNKVRSPWENRLMYSVLDVYPLEECQEIYSEQYVTRQNFCAGLMATGSGACNRDIGGPGIVSGVLAGVVSFGAPKCGTPDAPTVFTKVGFYVDWIEKIMEQNVPRGRQRTTNPPPKRTLPTIYDEPRPTPKTTTWQNEPVNTDSPAEVATTPTSETPSNDASDVQLVRDFLKTVFDSKEIQQYMDMFIDESSTSPRMYLNPGRLSNSAKIHLSATTKTPYKNPARIQLESIGAEFYEDPVETFSVTKVVDVEPITDKNGDLFEEPGKFTVIDKITDVEEFKEMPSEKKLPEYENEEQVIERNIMNLMESAKIKQMVEGSRISGTMVNESSKKDKLLYFSDIEKNETEAKSLDRKSYEETDNYLGEKFKNTYGRKNIGDASTEAEKFLDIANKLRSNASPGANQGNADDKSEVLSKK